MTEQEWLACTDLPLLIKILRANGQDRKLRLFACACVRRLGKELLSAQVREGVKAIEVAERFADGYASAQELAAAYHTGQSAWSAAEMAWASMISGGMAVALQEASSAALYVVMHTPGASAPAGTPNRKAKKASER